MTKKKISIRRARLNDVSAIMTCLRRLFEESPIGIHQRIPEEVDAMETGLKQLIQTKTCLFLIAIHDQEVIGTLSLTRHSKKETRHCCEFGMSVLSDFRNCGTGTKLIHKMMTWSKRNGIKKVNLQVWSNNTNAIRLYNRLGFLIEGIQKNQILHKANYYDLILMSKEI
jgi:RimJ/RimL family protein N-acetyltransferase